VGATGAWRSHSRGAYFANEQSGRQVRKVRRVRQSGPPPTLGELQRTTPWVWLWCERCQHHAPLACAVAVIRWGPEPASRINRQTKELLESRQQAAEASAARLRSLSAPWTLAVSPIVTKFSGGTVWFSCRGFPPPKQGVQTVHTCAKCCDVEHSAHHCQMTIERGALSPYRRSRCRPISVKNEGQCERVKEQYQGCQPCQRWNPSEIG